MKAAGGHSFYYIFLDHGLPRNIKSNNDAKSTMVPIEAHRSNLDLPVAGSAFFVLSQWQFFKGGWNVRWRNNRCPIPDSAPENHG